MDAIIGFRTADMIAQDGIPYYAKDLHTGRGLFLARNVRVTGDIHLRIDPVEMKEERRHHLNVVAKDATVWIDQPVSYGRRFVIAVSRDAVKINNTILRCGERQPYVKVCYIFDGQTIRFCNEVRIRGTAFLLYDTERRFLTGPAWIETDTEPELIDEAA